MIYEVYTDGSCSNNGGKNPRGGWAFVVVSGGHTIYECYGGEEGTTNNRMELMAALKAIRYMERLISSTDLVKIISDSAYFINCYNAKWYKQWMQNGWKTSTKKDVANQDLWQELIPYFSNPCFLFEKVTGHGTCGGNIRADKLAVLGGQEGGEISISFPTEQFDLLLAHVEGQFMQEKKVTKEKNL